MTVQVLIIESESESGWGQKIDDVLESSTEEAAIKYCKDYNTKHNPPSDITPSWYMYAKLANEPIFSPILRHDV